jgi:hypothetical protein
VASFYTQLLGDFQSAGGVDTIGGPWPGARVVVRDVQIYDVLADSTQAFVFGSTDSANLAGWAVAPVGQQLHWTGSQALTDDDSLQVVTDGTEVLFRVSGWVLLPFS